jgi:hypothetical protein
VTEFERLSRVPFGDGMTAWFLKGEAGAVQFVIMPLPMPVIRPEVLSIGEIIDGVLCMGIDIGYHSPTQMHEWQQPMNPCPIYGDVLCFYDGSSLAAGGLLTRWAQGNCAEEIIWADLEFRYSARFTYAPELWR